MVTYNTVSKWQGCGDMYNVLDDFLMVSKALAMTDNRLKTFLGFV